MNIKLILIFLLTIWQPSWSQNCDFEIRYLSDNLNGESELIKESEYKNASGMSEKFIEYTPISELELTKKYPKFFKIKDSCYSFLANNDNGIGVKKTKLKACKNKVQSKEYSDFEFKGVYFDNALIKVTGYEDWGFLSVSLKNGLTYFTMGKPLTSNGETTISYSNYYGEEEIALTDMETKKQYVIGIEGWRTIESITHQNIYYLKLEPAFRTDCKQNKKYLKIKAKN